MVEVIIAMAILFMIFTIVFPFLNSNTNAFKEVEIKQGLQNEGKKALEKVTKETLESSGVESVIQITPTGVEQEVKSATSITKVNSIIFKTANGFKIFTLKENHKLYYGSDTDKTKLSATEQIAENINSMELCPIGVKNFGETNGITVVLTLEKQTMGMGSGKITSSIESQIRFRNVE